MLAVAYVWMFSRTHTNVSQPRSYRCGAFYATLKAGCILHTMQKQIITFLTIVGGALGGYVPLLWGASYFSFASIVFSALGAMLGIYIGFKMTH